MKFLFFPHDCTSFHGKSLEERPLGGTETGVIGMADALVELGHEVFVLSSIPRPAQGKASYLHFALYHAVGDVDVLIAVRNYKNLFLPIPHKKRFYWTGDSHITLHNFGIGDPRVYNAIHGVFTVSNWHAFKLCKHSGLPKEKTWTLRNGVFLSNFTGTEVRKKERLIYSSTPRRGLKYLLPIFKELKLRHPNLELHLFCRTSRHNMTWPSENLYNGEALKVLSLFENLQGCYLHDSIMQKPLAREFMKSGIWTYPTDFEETSCITAMEAQAAGCAIVTSQLGALPETVGDAGILLKETPGTPEYLEQFIFRVDYLLQNQDHFNELSEKGLERAKGFDWRTRAISLLEYLKQHHGMQ